MKLWLSILAVSAANWLMKAGWFSESGTSRRPWSM